MCYITKAINQENEDPIMRKRLICVLLCLVLTLALFACGKAPEEKPADMQSSLPGAAAVEDEPEATETPLTEREAAIEEAVRKALKLKDRPVSELYDAIGEPESEDAAPSCMGKGEDVNLYYDGFTVYTYKEGNSQVVVDAEINK